MADEDQGVEGLLARAGRLPPGCIHQDVCCVAEGGRLSPVLVLESELCGAEVLVGEGGPISELYAAEEKAQVLCCWSGMAGLYRPGNSRDSRPIWNGELSLADGLPMDSGGGYTAVRVDDMGSLS